MTIRPTIVLAFAIVAALGASVARAAKPVADIVSPDLRKASVEIAEHLARPPAKAPLPSSLPTPFSPPNFDKGDRPDAGKAATANSAAQPTVAASDREALAAVAAKIPTTGSIELGGKRLLISGINKIEIGSHFTVVYSGQDYELELVAVSNTTFTVRYRGEEYTRPIHLQVPVPNKQGKSP
jgi:hypothetical protein